MLQLCNIHADDIKGVGMWVGIIGLGPIHSPTGYNSIPKSGRWAILKIVLLLFSEQQACLNLKTWKCVVCCVCGFMACALCWSWVKKKLTSDHCFGAYGWDPSNGRIEFWCRLDIHAYKFDNQPFFKMWIFLYPGWDGLGRLGPPVKWIDFSLRINFNF